MKRSALSKLRKKKKNTAGKFLTLKEKKIEPNFYYILWATQVETFDLRSDEWSRFPLHPNNAQLTAEFLQLLLVLPA